MAFTQEQKKAAYKRLPPDIQDLAMDNETTEIIASALKESGLDKTQVNIADSEILYALFCLQSLGDAINNIAKLANKNAGELSNVRSEIQNKVLSKYKIDINEFIELNKTNPAEKEAPIIITEETKEEAMARLKNMMGGGQKVQAAVPPPSAQGFGVAMEIKPDIHPMIEEGEVAHTVDSKQQIVDSEKQTQEKPKVAVPDYRYPKGKDPYREPTE